MTSTAILSTLALLTIFWAVGAYRRLARQRKRCKVAFAEVSAQLKLRHELVPKLVEIAGAHMQNERAVLEAAIAAGTEAVAANTKARANAFDLPAAARLSTAEMALDVALSTMLALARRSSALLSEQEMQQYVDQLSAEEKQVAFARQVYNEAATRYNAARTQFPVSLIAFVFAFTPAALLAHAEQ